MVTADNKAIPTAVPPHRIGKSALTLGECCITKTMAIIEIAQIAKLTEASVFVDCFVLIDIVSNHQLLITVA